MSADTFDFSQIRDRLLGPTGYEWALRDNFAFVQGVGGLASTADARLSTAIQCLLVGFDEPAQRLLQRSLEWVDIAIATGERPQRYFPNATEATWFQIRALCKWLWDNVHDMDSLKRFVEHKDLYLDRQRRKDKVGVALTLVTYVNAGAFDRTLELIQDKPNVRRRGGLSVSSEPQMAYVQSRHCLGLEFSVDETHAATDQFLAHNLTNWLSNGHWGRATEWIKTLLWNDTDRTLSAKHLLKTTVYGYLATRTGGAATKTGT